jgi:hypothetical protein
MPASDDDGALPAGATAQPALTCGSSPRPPVVWPAPEPLPAPFAPPLPLAPPLPVVPPPLPKIDPDEDDVVLPVVLPEVVPAPTPVLELVGPEVVVPLVAVAEAPLEELDELEHGALQLFCRHVIKFTYGWSLEQVDGGFAEPAHVMQFWSLPHATNWLQHELSMQESQAATPVGIWPAHAELPLLVLLELAVAVVVPPALELELVLEELPPHASGYVFEGSAPPGGATHA